jgi:predicted AAA+ superfamily ATPase
MHIDRTARTKLITALASGKVVIVLGARQVGKTTLVKQLVSEKQGTLLNLDTEVDKARLKAAAALPPLDALRSLGSPEVLVIDEAQQFPQTSRIVKGWFDEQVPAQIILLGSSSLNLLDQSVEALTGRNQKLFLPPLLFQEIVGAQSWHNAALPNEVIQEELHDQLQSTLLEAMVYGSYPEAVLTDDRETYLVNLSSDYLLKDVLQAGLVKSPQLLKRLVLFLAQHIGEELSTNHLAASLEMSRPTVERYLELLEDTYVIFRLPSYSAGGVAEITKSQKVFFWDTGVRNAILKEFALSPFRSDITQLWHNWVVAEVAKQNLLAGSPRDLYYWRTRNGGTVDLIVKDYKELKAFDISWTSRKTTGSRAFQQQYGTEVDIITHDAPLVLGKI